MLPHCAPPLVLPLLFLLAVTPADDVTTTRDRLTQAKRDYDAEAQKFHQSVIDALDKREADARSAGSKKVVDQVKAERKAFEERGELPAWVPSALRQQGIANRTRLTKSYEAGIRGLLKLKEDAAVEAVEKERRLFMTETAVLFGKRTFVTTLRPTAVSVRTDVPFRSDGNAETKKPVKLNGEPAPHSLYTVPPDKGAAQVKYSTGGRFMVFKATVGVPKFEDTAAGPASAATFEVIGDGKSLWKSKPIAKNDEFQTCEVLIERAKVLTLKVHCEDSSDWVRACWIEAVLFE